MVKNDSTLPGSVRVATKCTFERHDSNKKPRYVGRADYDSTLSKVAAREIPYLAAPERGHIYEWHMEQLKTTMGLLHLPCVLIKWIVRSSTSRWYALFLQQYFYPIMVPSLPWGRIETTWPTNSQIRLGVQKYCTHSHHLCAVLGADAHKYKNSQYKYYFLYYIIIIKSCYTHFLLCTEPKNLCQHFGLAPSKYKDVLESTKCQSLSNLPYN